MDNISHRRKKSNRYCDKTLIFFITLIFGGSAKSPGREFLMDYEKDKTGNFERGYS